MSEQIWVCTKCGERYSGDSPGVSLEDCARWRWNGLTYEHHHEYPLGHVRAVPEIDYFPARVAELERELSCVVNQIRMAGLCGDHDDCYTERPWTGVAVLRDRRDRLAAEVNLLTAHNRATRAVVEAAVAWCSPDACGTEHDRLHDAVRDYLAAQEVDGEV